MNINKLLNTPVGNFNSYQPQTKNIAPVVGAGLITAGASLVGSVLGANSQDKANKANLEAMRENQAWQEKMWNMQNEYNTPEHQLGLMMDAGYNPLYALNAMNGVSGAGSVGAVGNSQAQAADFSAISNAGATIGNNIMQADLLESQIRKNLADASYSNQQAWTESELRKYKIANEKMLSGVSQAQIDVLKEQAGKIKAEKSYTYALRDFTDAQRDLLDMNMPVLLALSRAQLMEVYEHCRLMASQRGVNVAQAKYYNGYVGILDSIKTLNYASAGNQNAQADYISGAQTNLSNANVGLVNSQTTGQDIQNNINDDTKGAQKVGIVAGAVSQLINAIDGGYDFVTKVGTDIFTKGGSAVSRNVRGFKK